VSDSAATPSAPEGAEGMLARAIRTILVALASLAVAAIIVLPAVDLFFARAFFRGLSEAGSIVDHATLVLAFAAAALATLDRRHISLSGGEERPRKPWERTAGGFGDLVAVTAQTCLFWASLSLTFTGFDAAGRVWIVPIRIIAAVMPLCLGLMTVLTILGSGASTRACAGADADTGDEVGRPERIARRSAAALGLVLGSLLAASSICNLAALASGPETNAAPAFLQALASAVRAFVGKHGLVLGLLVGLSLPFGTPIFAVLGGIAAILFVGNGAYLELAPSEAYALLKGGSISALPLFGIAGILLAESGAGKRFVAVFREFFGWFRGGEAIAAILACAVFSTFTGVNGVTIVALGGILVAALVDSGGMSEERAQGLITASGDIGLLLPPSAAVIVYGINAQFLYSSDEGFSIVSLFKGALVPGCLIVAAMCVAGVFLTPNRSLRGTRGEARSERSFKARSALAALKPAALELLVPVLAIVLYFTGFASLREVGALSVLYIVIVEAFVKREFTFKGLIGALGKSFPIVGGTLIIIAVARGLSFYLIDANIPEIFTSWIQSVIHSKILFLLLLNLFLLVVGCLMDIFSAILVVSPFLIPLGAAFGVPPVQFGVIFLMNLLLGFLTPPVGMNLFLSSYTFREPMPRVIRNTWPFLLVQFAVLMLVTYVPALSTILK
jgi:C4-dicarboxylate transporter, DctM subunit